MQTAAYEVTRQPFQYDYYEELAAPVVIAPEGVNAAPPATSWIDNARVPDRALSGSQ